MGSWRWEASPRADEGQTPPFSNRSRPGGDAKLSADDRLKPYTGLAAGRGTISFIGLSGLASLGGILFARLHAWPLWALALAALVPLLPFLATLTLGIYRRNQWLALFTVLVFTQGGHVIEHLAQMYQLHVLGLRGVAAQGIFGVFNIEWVHFAWNTWILVAVVLLVRAFRTNPWLWVTLVAAVWHELEHVAIMAAYLTTGVAGTPGLLAHGGLIGGGLPLSRPDLHFLYNVIESIPLAAAFGWQLASMEKAPRPASRASLDQP